MLIRALAAAVTAGLALSPVQQSSPSPPPQQQQPPVPVFRSGTDLVPVTVTVTDQQGRPLNALRQSDFRVFENGKPRPIETFYPQLLEPGPVVEPAMSIAGVRRPGVTPATRRTFMLVLGFGRIQEPTSALDGAMKFVREHLLPQDAVGVIALHRATKITTDHRAIEKVLERYKSHHERMVWDIVSFFRRTRAYGTCGGPPLPADMLAGFDRDLFGDVLPPTAIRGTLDLILGMDLAAPTGERRWQEQLRFDQLLKDIEQACLNLSDVMTTSGRFRLLAAIEALRYVEGEKHVIFLGHSLTPARGRELVIARANDARVTIDFVSTSGMYVSPSGRSSFSGCQPCRDVVEATGGLYTSVDYMDQALAKVDQRSRTSYLIGYSPASTALDGTYRQIRVEVNRPKAAVSYRNGYFASEQPDALALHDLVETARTDAATKYNVDATAIPVTVTAVNHTGSPPSVEVNITVALSTIPLQLMDGFRTGRLDITVYCGDAKEKVVGESQVSWNLRANEATYADWVARGLTRTMTVPVTAKAKFVKVIVYDKTADLVGSKSIEIR